MRDSEPAGVPASRLLPRERYKLDRLLRLPEVMALTGHCKSQIYVVIAGKKYLQPIKHGRMSLWPESEVAEFIESLKAAREK